MKNDGALIEDDGILADYPLIRPNLQDLIPGTVSNSQYDKIADLLKNIGKKQGKNDLYFTAKPEAVFDSYLGTPLAFNLDLSGISKIQVFSEGNPVGSALVLSNTNRQQRQIRFDPGFSNSSYRSFELRAFNSKGKTLFSTMRTVRFLPNPANYLKIQSGSLINLDLVNGGEIAQFDVHTEAGLGFVANGTSLQVGNGIAYTNNVDTQRSYYLQASAPFTVAIDADYQTEKGFDYLFFGYATKDGKRVQFLSGPGSSEQQTTVPAASGKGSLNLTQTYQVAATGTVELFVRFVSDGGVVDSGVTIRSISIQA